MNIQRYIFAALFLVSLFTFRLQAQDFESFGKGQAACVETAQPEQILTPDERLFLTLINQYRAKYRLQPLQASKCLTVVSRWMSYDMGKKNYFDHADSFGRRPDQRCQKFGIYTFSGENIGAGYDDAHAMFKGWKESPGHNRNMLSRNHKYIGIGKVSVPNSKFGTYWTTDFGR